MSFHVGFRCDGGPEIGVGHVIRCLALGEELLARGAQVTFLGHIDGVPWVTEQIQSLGIPIVDAPREPDALTSVALRLGLHAVVLDGYDLDDRCGTLLRQARITVLSIADGPFGADQEADIVLDQNLGAAIEPPPPAIALAGLRYVLFRDHVLRRRRPMEEPTEVHSPARVLTVFGGTDAYAAGPVVVPMLLDTERAVHVIAVAARDDVAESLHSLSVSPGQQVDVVPPVEDLARLAVTCDLVVTAAGTSVWELLCLGVPAAVVCVTDNQRIGYEAVAREGLAVPVGELDSLRRDAAARAAGVHALRQALSDPGSLRVLAARGQELIDGRGRERVADALLSAVSDRLAE